MQVDVGSGETRGSNTVATGFGRMRSAFAGGAESVGETFHVASHFRCPLEVFNSFAMFYLDHKPFLVLQELDRANFVEANRVVANDSLTDEFDVDHRVHLLRVDNAARADVGLDERSGFANGIASAQALGRVLSRLPLDGETSAGEKRKD